MGVGARIYDLLNHYNLTDRIIQKNIDYEQAIAYDSINTKLEEDRNNSMMLLEKILLPADRCH